MARLAGLAVWCVVVAVAVAGFTAFHYAFPVPRIMTPATKAQYVTGPPFEAVIQHIDREFKSPNPYSYEIDDKESHE